MPYDNRFQSKRYAVKNIFLSRSRSAQLSSGRVRVKKFKFKI